MTIYLYNVQIRMFSNILYVIRSQIPIVVWRTRSNSITKEDVWYIDENASHRTSG
jgi:hypothetical protein